MKNREKGNLGMAKQLLNLGFNRKKLSPESSLLCYIEGSNRNHEKSPIPYQNSGHTGPRISTKRSDDQNDPRGRRCVQAKFFAFFAR